MPNLRKAKQEQEERPLAEHLSLQKAMSNFKKRCRRVRIFCTDEGDEEHLTTSYKQINRLKPMGIENKHATIKGMPVLKTGDAKMITQAILAMRGINQRKHKEQHEEGNLKLQLRPMAYKGTARSKLRN